MDVDANSIDRIRTADFPLVRKGYDPRQVEAFLNRLADWLETGGGDQARADVVRREIERVGEKTATILATAEDSAQQLRGDAEREVAQMLEQAEADTTRARTEADAYAAKTRDDADAYSAKQRGEADEYAAKERGDADAYAAKTRESTDAEAERKQEVAEQRAAEIVEAAERKASRIVADGTRRRREIERVISDLVAHRNEAVAQARSLVEKLEAAAAAHTPEDGKDPFTQPRELDPADRGEMVEEEAGGDGSEAETKNVEVGDEASAAGDGQAEAAEGVKA
jgi:DivIVA domain-containing protein